MSIISGIRVENFRALKFIDFRLQRLAVLIGENDVGKTSVLTALDVFFSNKKLIDRYDYHQFDTSKNVVIQLTLEKDGQEVIVRRTFQLDKSPVTDWYQDGSFQKMSKEDQETFIPADSFYFFPVNRDISVQLAMTKTAMLGRLIRERVRSKIAQSDVRESIESLVKHTRDAISEPREHLERLLREQMHNNSLRLEFENLVVDPVDGVSFSVGLADDRVGVVPLANRGAGTQNNLIIALFRYLAESKTDSDLIIALEEPENSLHPKAQRQLLSALFDLATKNQIITTTHSPVFIERTQYESNVLITRKSDGRSDAKVFNDKMLTDVRDELGIRPSDALLKGGGNCALIVEGSTEEECMPIFMESQGSSEFELGISIINAQGCDYDRISRICLLLKSFDIPAVVMLDQDAKKHAEDLRRAAEQGELSNLEEVYVLSKGTIEEYFTREVIAKVLNEDFEPNTEIFVDDIPQDAYGKDLMGSIRRLMHDRNCGKGIDYFKKMLGLKGSSYMIESGISLDAELVDVVQKVAEIARRT